MIVQPEPVKLKNGLAVELRSPKPEEASLVLEHLKISHRESYRNLNQSPEYWETVSVADEAKILTDFESSEGPRNEISSRGANGKNFESAGDCALRESRIRARGTSARCCVHRRQIFG